jgi:tetratricopeptide (TPR) repeat protein
MRPFQQILAALGAGLASSVLLSTTAFADDARICVMGKGAQRFQACDRVIASDPKSVLGYRLRASAHRAAGNFQSAIADYSEAIRLAPNDGYQYNLRGSTHREKGDLPAAIADYSQAIRLEPAFGDYYAKRGIAHREAKQFGKAVSDLKKALQLGALSKPQQSEWERELALAQQGVHASSVD